MVKLYCHSGRLTVLSSRSNRGPGAKGHRAASGPLPLGLCRGQLYKQSQFARPGRVGRGLEGVDRGQLFKQTQFGAPSREEGCHCEQTKPIGQVACRAKQSQSAAGARQWARAARSPRPALGANVQNKPNFRRGPRVPIVRNEPNCPKRGTEAVSRLRIGDRLAAGRLPCGLRRAKRAKRTQFRALRPSRDPIIPVFQHSSIPAFQSPRCRVGRGPRGVGRGAIVRTKPRSGSR